MQATNICPTKTQKMRGGGVSNIGKHSAFVINTEPVYKINPSNTIFVDLKRA